ncbi:lysozyme [Klebsiella pneumoniae]|uniref:lysozyme n=1 Tax=Klebsiella pneumoniae TaxID=573 RepID=UPI000BC7518D|nr:lysozyme [Klebsiella pneumoniae]MCS6069681.1 lysozyme [Klebsiella pneumoniae subsp. pneumoniae]MDE2553921.1 lysozyme [Klebsiella pneumoniae]MDW1569768.1 lysozyme [Klebsiella pneumoniae]PCQ75757.1 muraminidase [Klebsiella pneumoniae]GCD28302.1 lysozyme RrrD [Klebsiella pneumoniae]
MQISNNGIALIKRFEGCRLTAYPDPGTGGDPWTIGYGWTGKVDGKPIRPGMKIDDATADRLLRTGVVSFDQAVSKMLKVTVTQNQYDALVSLAYNIGTRALSTSTLMKKLNAGDVKGAADEFLRWNRSGGKVMTGLANRRKAEREVFLS